MISLINNELSFLQWAKGNTPPACNTPILFNDNGDLKFHVVLSGPEIETAITVPLKLYLLPIDFAPTDLASIQTAAIAKHETGFAAEQLSTSKAVFYQLNKLYNDTLPFTLTAEGKCFRIAIALDQTIDGEKPYWLSNCILRSPAADDYSSSIEYSCEENSYGFYYCNSDITNIVRVPFYFFATQFTDDEDIYFRSDGSAHIIKSVTRAELSADVDYADKNFHKKLKVALSHDFVYVKSTDYTGGIVKNGGYEIDWPKDKTVRIAKGSFKAFETPFLVRNDNCAECNSPFGDCPALLNVQLQVVNNDDGTQTFTLTWDNAGLELADSVNIGYKFNGSPDAYTYVNGSKLSPRTLTVPLGKYDIQLQTVGTGEEDSCETFNNDLLSNVGITPDECVPVAQQDVDFALPNATTTQAYSAEMILTGTGPFTLSSIVKPTWMTITVVANKIVFGGTPGSGDVGTGIAVSFTVSNCDGDSTLDFADTINVALKVGEVRITSSMVGCMIANVTGIPGFTFGTPLAPGQSQTGTHSAFTGAIAIQITGTPVFNPSNVALEKGPTTISCIAVVAGNTFIFPSTAFLTTDDIHVSANIGACA
jgi:hypothetical protein